VTPDDLAAIVARAEAARERGDAGAVGSAQTFADDDVHTLLAHGHAQAAEVARLTACLGRANASMEETERDLYLRLGALETAAREYVAAVDGAESATCGRSEPDVRGYIDRTGRAIAAREAARVRLLAAIGGAP